MPRKPYGGKVIESTLLLSVAGIRLPTHPFLGMKKPSYATAEDPDSELAKNQIRSRSREAPAERARSAYDGCELSKYPFLGMKKPLTHPS